MPHKIHDIHPHIISNDDSRYPRSPLGGKQSDWSKDHQVTAEDMLARRWRLLFLDARLAAGMAVRVGAILQEETGVDPQVAAFEARLRSGRSPLEAICDLAGVDATEVLGSAANGEAL